MIRLTSIVCLFVSGIQCYEFSSKRELVKSLSWKSNYNADYHAIGGGCPQKLLFVPLPSTLPPNLVSALQSIQELLEATINTTSVPGASISITYNGKNLLSYSSGFADKASQRLVSESTIWRIGSVTKLVPATMLKIMQVGDIAVNFFAPSFAPINLFDDSNITFNQIASQQSGLQREAPFGVNTTDEALVAVSRTILVQPPGGRPSYSNLGFAILGHVLGEKVAKSTFRELSSELIFEPLGTTSTGFNYSTPDIMERLATGYDILGNEVPFTNLGWVEPAGGAYSSLSDLDLLAIDLLSAISSRTSRLGLSPAAARDFLSPVYYNPDGLSLFGRPWEIQVISTNVSSLLAFSKGGNLNGYSTYFSLLPDLSLSITAAFNGNVDEFAFGMDVLSALVFPFIETLTKLQPPLPFNPSLSPQDYVGTYLLEGTEVLVRFEQGMLLWYNSAVSVQVILDHFQDDTFQAAFPDSSFPCLQGELEALRFQYVVFKRNSTDIVFSTEMQGWIPGAIWTR
jgi:CubicO group peptidase (beta-lactamase class C family)